MKKDITITVLIILSIILLSSVASMSSEASYWMNRALAAEEVLDEMIDHDEDYFLDVVMERDCYNTWHSLGGNQ